MLPSLLSAKPSPVAPGATVTICFDFRGGASSPVNIEISPSGAGSKVSVTLSTANPCTTYTVPIGCTGIIVTDLSGQSTDLGIPVTP